MRNSIFILITFLIAVSDCTKEEAVTPVEPVLIEIDSLLDFTTDDEVNDCIDFEALLIDSNLEYYFTGALFPNFDGIASFNSDNTITNVSGDLFGDSWLPVTLTSNDTIFIFCNVIELTIRNQDSQQLVKDTLTFARMTVDASGVFSRDTSINFILFREN